jgi:hypothetical protein
MESHLTARAPQTTTAAKINSRSPKRIFFAMDRIFAETTIISKKTMK